MDSENFVDTLKSTTVARWFLLAAFVTTGTQTFTRDDTKAKVSELASTVLRAMSTHSALVCERKPGAFSSGFFDGFSKPKECLNH
jgi:hypothetical protein